MTTRFGTHPYDLSRVRLWSGEGHTLPDDDFSYVLDSIDCWYIALRDLDDRPIALVSMEAKPYRLNGEQVPGLTPLTWETEQLAETFCSYVGYAGPGSDEVVYNPGPLMEGFDLPHNRDVRPVPVDGQALMTLVRRSDVPYRHAGMFEIANQERPAVPSMNLRLTDERGDIHRVNIGFLDTNKEDHRNYLVLEVLPAAE